LNRPEIGRVTCEYQKLVRFLLTECEMSCNVEYRFPVRQILPLFPIDDRLARHPHIISECLLTYRRTAPIET